jgi:hypothetical protein
VVSKKGVILSASKDECVGMNGCANFLTVFLGNSGSKRVFSSLSRRDRAFTFCLDTKSNKKVKSERITSARPAVLPAAGFGAPSLNLKRHSRQRVARPLRRSQRFFLFCFRTESWESFNPTNHGSDKGGCCADSAGRRFFVYALGRNRVYQ